MSRARQGLRELIESAYERCAPALWAELVLEMYDVEADSSGELWPYTTRVEMAVSGMEECLDSARAADYWQALLFARAAEDEAKYLISSAPEWLEACVGKLKADRLALAPLLEACELADRIDGFLAVMERPGPGRALAVGCRDDLDGLLVLADWCEENGLPAAAREARHLAGLVRGGGW